MYCMLHTSTKYCTITNLDIIIGHLPAVNRETESSPHHEEACRNADTSSASLVSQLQKANSGLYGGGTTDDTSRDPGIIVSEAHGLVYLGYMVGALPCKSAPCKSALLVIM